MSRGGGGGDLNPKLDMTKVPPDDALYYYLTKTYRVWMLTGNVQDPDMDAQMTLSFQRRKAQLEDEANRLANINESMRLELERAKEEGVSGYLHGYFRHHEPQATSLPSLSNASPPSPFFMCLRIVLNSRLGKRASHSQAGH